MLKSILKNLNGNIITIGLKQNLENLLEKKSDVLNLYCLNSIGKKGKGKSILDTIYVEDFKHKFKEKNIDYIVVNYDDVKDKLGKFINETINITKGKIYYIGNIEVNNLKKNYKRHNIIFDEKDNSVLINDYFVGFIKKWFFYKIDNFLDFVNKITEIVKW